MALAVPAGRPTRDCPGRGDDLLPDRPAARRALADVNREGLPAGGAGARERRDTAARSGGMVARPRGPAPGDLVAGPRLLRDRHDVVWLQPLDADGGEEHD